VPVSNHYIACIHLIFVFQLLPFDWVQTEIQILWPVYEYVHRNHPVRLKKKREKIEEITENVCPAHTLTLQRQGT
jgi:hypothetical protein